jgi:hypothetical protein
VGFVILEGHITISLSVEAGSLVMLRTWISKTVLASVTVRLDPAWTVMAVTNGPDIVETVVVVT